MARSDLMPNYRVGAYYAAGTVVLAGLAAAGWPWSAVLLWPATSCGIVAAAYFGVGPRVYRKRDGRLGLLTRVLMAPVLIGQDLSLRHYRRQGHAWDRVAPELIMGRLLNDDEAEILLESGVSSVLDLTAEFSEADVLRRTGYGHLPILDLTAPTATQLQRAVDFIRAGAADGVVYVHCKIGYSRTAAVVGAYLIATGHVSNAEEAMTRMRQARSPIVIRTEVVTALHAFEARFRAIAAN